MTDWQQPMVTLLTQADGVSVVHETVYEQRFGYTSTLNDMGANITLTNDCLGGKECRFTDRNFPHSAIVQGATPLTGREIEIPDLRAGFAYLLAALIADGETTIFGTQIHRTGLRKRARAPRERRRGHRCAAAARTRGCLRQCVARPHGRGSPSGTLPPYGRSRTGSSPA